MAKVVNLNDNPSNLVGKLKGKKPCSQVIYTWQLSSPPVLSF